MSILSAPECTTLKVNLLAADVEFFDGQIRGTRSVLQSLEAKNLVVRRGGWNYSYEVYLTSAGYQLASELGYLRNFEKWATEIEAATSGVAAA